MGLTDRLVPHSTSALRRTVKDHDASGPHHDIPARHQAGKTRQVAASGQVPSPGKTGNYLYMSIAIPEEHRALAESVAGFLTDHQSRAAARALLTAEAEGLPDFWCDPAAPG